MRHVAAGDPIWVVIVTDGALGLPLDTPDAALVRQRESLCAAQVLGYGEPVFWGLPDRGLEYGEELIGRILTALDETGAELVYAPSWWEIHPDHLALALAAAEAVRRCPRPIQLAMYEVGMPLHPSRLLDITDLHTRKQAAMACFTSQLAQQDYGRHITALNTFRTYTLPGTVKLAEAYRLIERAALLAEPLRRVRPGLNDAPDLSSVAALPTLSSMAALGIDIRGLLHALASPSAVESELARMQMALEQRSGEIETLRQSTSWRITAPLRWLALTIRRLLGSR